MSVIISFLIISICFGYILNYISENMGYRISNTINQKNININERDTRLAYLDIVNTDYRTNGQVYKIVIQLDFKNTPITAHNFYELCRLKKFANIPFHRIINNFMIQGGDITNLDGTGGMSHDGESFKDENFINKHDEPGVISMANSGKDTNTSQFFILLKPSPHLDGKHVAFGKVIKGMKYIESIGKTEVDFMDRPIQSVYIKSSYVKQT